MNESFINELRRRRDMKASEQRRKRKEAQGLMPVNTHANKKSKKKTCEHRSL